MTRKKKVPMTPPFNDKSFRLAAQLLEIFDAEAKARGLTRGQHFEQILRERYGLNPDPKVFAAESLTEPQRSEMEAIDDRAVN